MEVASAGFFASPAVIIAGLVLLGVVLVAKFGKRSRIPAKDPRS